MGSVPDYVRKKYGPLQQKSLKNALAQRIEQASRALVQVPQGSLYPALHRLEGRGLLAASWVDTDTGRRAKVYRLTRKGRTALDREVAGWQRLSKAIEWVLQT